MTRYMNTNYIMNNYDKLVDSVINNFENRLNNNNDDIAANIIRGKLLLKDNYGIKNYEVKEGDICNIEFGSDCKFETPNLHYGVVLKTTKTGNCFVVPLTSNNKAINGAIYNNNYYKLVGDILSNHTPTAATLIDAKWISSERIMSIKSHMDINSKEYIELKRDTIECIW